ncbi:MAG: hypothetical protein R3D84_11515 [Paracoccaceae bacterium]
MKERTRLFFFVDDEGAVTVDWVVLTASVVGLGVAAFNTIGGSVDNVGSGVDDKLSSAAIQTDLSSLGQGQ